MARQFDWLVYLEWPAVTSTCQMTEAATDTIINLDHYQAINYINLDVFYSN